MAVSAFVVRDDGYTRRCYIRAVHNLYPDIRFEFRPTTLMERSELVDVYERQKSTSRKNEIIAKYIASKIVSWDIALGSKADGDVAPITAKSIIELSPDLFSRMRNIVAFMQDGGDVDPDDPEESKELEEDTLSFLEKLEKNS